MQAGNRTAVHTAERATTPGKLNDGGLQKPGAGMYHARLHLSFYPYEGI
jgi:hypothetical protein